MKQKFVCTTLLAFAIFSPALPAATFQGRFWSVPAATAENVPTPGNTPGPGATLWGTFDASALQFSGDTNYSLGGFLNSFSAASNITYLNGASASSSLTDVLFEFTGTAQFTNGTSYDVLHDDGINLYVNGASVLNAPSPTGPIISSFTYTGPSGVQALDFVYANGPASQADFQTSLVPAVAATPEPSAAFLLPVGIAVFGLLRLRRKRTSAALP